MDSKSFRSNHKKVKYADKSAKPSLFAKFKQVVTPIVSKYISKKNNGNDEDKSKARELHGFKRIPSVTLPGGFFNPDASTSKFSAKKNNADDSFYDGFKSSITSIQKYEEDGEVTIDPNVSNAKLSAFFAQKGDQPLSDMEKEGILSILRRTARDAEYTTKLHDTPGPYSISPSRILKSTNSSLNNTPVKAPTFIPKFDNNSVSKNSSLPSVRRRRIFEYSNLPSNYKTTVFRYSSIPSSAPQSNINLSNSEKTKSAVTKPYSEKNSSKISNTASALLSLLDDHSKESNELSELVNPYSSHLSKVREYKNNQVDQSKNTSTRDSSVQAKVIDENRSNKLDSYSSLKSNESAITVPTFDKYKPARSSSLRSSVLAEEKLLDKNENSKETKVKPSTETFQFGKLISSTDPISTKTEKSEGKVQDKTLFQFKPSTAPLFSSSSTQDDINQKEIEKEEELEVENANSSVIKILNASKDVKPKFIFGKPENSSLSQSLTKEVRADPSLIETKAETKKVFQPTIPNFAKAESHEVEIKTVGDLAEDFKFDFGDPIASHIVLKEINDSKVEEYKAMFVF